VWTPLTPVGTSASIPNFDNSKTYFVRVMATGNGEYDDSGWSTARQPIMDIDQYKLTDPAVTGNTVNLQDFLVFLKAFGKKVADHPDNPTIEHANFTGSGVVNLNDFLLFLKAFGKTVPQGTTLAAPSQANTDMAVVMGLSGNTDNTDLNISQSVSAFGGVLLQDELTPVFDDEPVSIANMVATVPQRAVYVSSISDLAFGTSLTSDIAQIATYYDTASTAKPAIKTASTTAIHDQAIESMLREDDKDRDAWDGEAWDSDNLLATTL